MADEKNPKPAVKPVKKQVPTENGAEKTSGIQDDLHMQNTILRRLLASSRYLNALLLALIIAIATFHPWIMEFVSKALGIVPLLLLVVVFVYVVNPIVGLVMRQIQRLPGRRWFSYQKALPITYIMLLLIIAAIAICCVPNMMRELANLADHFPALARTVQSKMVEYREFYDRLPVPVRIKLSESVGAIGAWVGGFIDGSLAYAGVVSSAVIWCIGATVMVPLISYYLLADGEEIFEYLLSFLPVKNRAITRSACNCVHETMQKFIRGQVMLCLAVGGVTTAALAFVMPQYCLALGVVAGITEAIPIIGPILGAVPAIIIAIAVPGGGWTKVLVVLGIYIVIQQLENNLLVPRIMGSSMGLHPLSLTLGMLVLGDIFGFWGVVFASPIIALIKSTATALCKANLEEAEAERAAAADKESASAEN